MKYMVTFVQNHTYTVDAMNEDEAFDKAYEEFKGDMRSSIAASWYDGVDIECDEEDCDCDTCRWEDMPIDAIDNPCWNCKGDYSEWSPKE